MTLTRPPGEAETMARLEARVAGTTLRACNGCADCATRCTDNLDFTYPEFTRLLAQVRALDPAEAARVLAQDKRLLWEGETLAFLCPFLDRKRDRCLVYAARPLICRLFGIVPWLPCPHGRVAAPLPDALAIIQAYAALERHPLREWLRRTGTRIPELAGGERNRDLA